MNAPRLAVETVLIPVDGSDESLAAVEYGVSIAETYGASAHVVYVLDEDVVRALEFDVIETGEVSTETNSFFEEIRSTVGGHDVPLTTSMAYGFSPRRKMQHPGSVILDCAEEVDADFIVIPREPLNEEPADVLAKAAEYVLSYASQPVLSV